MTKITVLFYLFSHPEFLQFQDQHSHDKRFCFAGSNTAEINNNVLVEQLLCINGITGKYHPVDSISEGFQPCQKGTFIGTFVFSIIVTGIYDSPNISGHISESRIKIISIDICRAAEVPATV